MFSYPQFVAVSFSGDPSRISGYQEGNENTTYSCIRSKLENRFRHHSRELGAIYSMPVLLAAAVLAAVHHAEVVAHAVGEPYGSLVLAVAVTVIEVGLIVTLCIVVVRLAISPSSPTPTKNTLN